ATYEAEMRVQGSVYARMGISFAGWYDLVRAFQRILVPHLMRAYRRDDARLVGALDGMQRFADRVMVVIGEQYLDTKEELLTAERERNRALEAAAAAAALRQSEERFRTFVESVKDYALIILDPDGHVTSWNAGAERLKGYRPDEIVGRH